jgi:hypothetical protein
MGNKSNQIFFLHFMKIDKLVFIPLKGALKRVPVFRVKTLNLRWLSKKLHMRGASIFYHFGVLGYVVMIENWQQRSR